MKSMFLPILGLLFLGLPQGIQANEAEGLIQTHCVSCHTLRIPPANMIATLEAPPMNAVIFHLKNEIKDEKKRKKFIIDYSLKPQPLEAVCDTTKVEKFGVMPSLAGKVSKEELGIMAEHLLENYPTKKFVLSRAEAKLYEKIAELRTSPFLMNQSALPQLTRLLMESWGKGKLGLSPLQKKGLLAIRHQVVTDITQIKERLDTLESDIIAMTIYEEELPLIEIKVTETAKLKAKATMIQIKCLRESIEILNDKQMSVLLPLWGM